MSVLLLSVLLFSKSKNLPQKILRSPEPILGRFPFDGIAPSSGLSPFLRLCLAHSKLGFKN